MTNYVCNIYECRYKLRLIVPRDENIQIEQNTSVTFPCSCENNFILFRQSAFLLFYSLYVDWIDENKTKNLYFWSSFSNSVFTGSHACIVFFNTCGLRKFPKFDVFSFFFFFDEGISLISVLHNKIIYDTSVLNGVKP